MPVVSWFLHRLAEQRIRSESALAQPLLQPGFVPPDLPQQHVHQLIHRFVGILGGLFGAAAECLGRTYPVPLRCVAVEDQFVNSGTPEELREYYGLTWKEIVDASAQAWALRRR